MCASSNAGNKVVFWLKPTHHPRTDKAPGAQPENFWNRWTWIHDSNAKVQHHLFWVTKPQEGSQSADCHPSISISHKKLASACSACFLGTLLLWKRTLCFACLKGICFVMDLCTLLSDSHWCDGLMEDWQTRYSAGTATCPPGLLISVHQPYTPERRVSSKAPAQGKNHQSPSNLNLESLRIMFSVRWKLHLMFFVRKAGGFFKAESPGMWQRHERHL